MSETPGSYNPHSNKNPAALRVANFMNGFLGPELLMDYPWPKRLHKPYQDLTPAEQTEWFELAFNMVFRDAKLEIVGLLGRELKVVELNLIKRRILDYFQELRIEYEK
jgi:hypothetical protein